MAYFSFGTYYKCQKYSSNILWKKKSITINERLRERKKRIARQERILYDLLSTTDNKIIIFFRSMAPNRNK
jgi:hypothetical protein